MPNSSSPPSSPILIGPKPKQSPPDISALNLMPDKQKKTRDLPNLSDCHGCGRRINYTNPRERLQPLDSVWRIVLLCKKCRKQVNSGKLCPYCFKDVSESVSDCFSCANCHHLVHKNCIMKYENSAPCSYSNEVGQEVTVCIDCWVPELLKRSIRVRGKKSDKGKGLAVSRNNIHCENSGKDLGASRSLIEVANEAEYVQEKVAFAVKAKETGLMKAVAARSVVESPNNALDLVVKKNDNGKEKAGLVGDSDNGSRSSDSTRVVDDAELALQLHHAMNSSARILKNTCLMKVSCSDLLKISDSFGVLKKSMDFKHNGKDGKIAGCNTTLENRIHGGNISVEPTGVEANGSCTFTGSAGLKRELFTYKRNNRKRKKLQQSCMEAGGNYTSTYSCMLKPELFTYKRNSRKRKDSQQPKVEANGICSCSGSSVLKPELVTYMRNNRKRKEHQQSVVEPNGSCSTIEIGDLKPELFYCEQNDGKRKECQLSGQEANGSCTFVYSAASNPELVTYKRNRKRKECRQFGVQASESCNCNDCVGLNSEVVTYKRKNRKRKECERCGKGGNLGFIDGSVEKHTHAGDSSLVTESHSSMQDEPKGEFYSKDGRSSTPEGRITDFGAEDRNSNSMADICLLIDYERSSEGDDSTQGRSGNSYPGRFSLKYSRRASRILHDISSKSNCDRCLLKYGRRIKCSGENLHGERMSAHKETNLGSASFQTEAQISALGAQTCCSGKHSTLSESSCDVNIEACSCGVGSSQGEA